MLHLQANFITFFLLGKIASAISQRNVTDELGEVRTGSTGLLNISGERSASTTNRSNLGTVIVTCDGSKYGDSLIQSSCLQALNQISHDTTLIGFRPRVVGQLGNLPWRFISGDGRCCFDIASSQAELAHASLMSFASAGNSLIRRCASQPRHIVGGIATGLGVEGVLSLEMRSYQPSIACGEPFGPPPQNCIDIIRIMPTGTGKRRFGRRGTPGIDVPLGIYLHSDNPGCQVIIDATAPVETASWYSLWEAMVAIDGMCVRQGKMGSAYLLGDLGHIYIEMRYDPIDGIASS